MRKIFLIALFALASANAQAGVSRGLIVASSDDAAAAVEQPGPDKAVDNAAKGPQAILAPKTTEAPAYVARPAAVDTAPAAPRADQGKSVPDKTAVVRIDKPKHGHESTEARVIYELHRHGIYW